ncbi:hypothetical protein [Quadrisphaera sp. INWT6]|uniref:hypothetical protein n=1 Tax=Quadrisphaera sp. INWT6 TaxID=2596917 RepID=UPI001892827C|nr:hypothetical protein [Quadrisphaera sp. INWT6]
MHPEVEAAEAPGLPRWARLGLLGAVALSVLGLLSALPGVLGSGSQHGEAPAPYGVAGCVPPAGAGPVDVAVTARAVDDDGEPQPTLGGAGLDVGASVRDLGGYAAEGVPPCDVVQVSVHLHDPAAGGTVEGSLEPGPAPLDVRGEGGGELVAVDWSTWAASLPQSARGGELHEQAAWLVTLVDPRPGTYRLAGRVTAADATGASGDVEVLVTVVPST